MYEYKAFVTKVYDGDTITVDIDLGFNVVLRNEKIRLFGINAPEKRRPTLDEGRASQVALYDQIFNQNIIIKTFKDKKGKYGRWIGVIFFNDQNMNEWMVENGHAITADY